MPAALITLRHLSISLCMYLANSAGLLPTGSTPSRDRRSFISGLFVTPINEKLYEKNKENIEREIPLKRTGGPDDLKGIVVLLASGASNFMTGAIIPVDGGAVAL